MSYKTLASIVGEEMLAFKSEELKKSPIEIFYDAAKIKFFSDMAEFLSQGSEEWAYFDENCASALCTHSGSVISLLYDHYCKKSKLSADDWDDLNEIVEDFCG